MPTDLLHSLVHVGFTGWLHVPQPPQALVYAVPSSAHRTNASQTKQQLVESVLILVLKVTS